MVKSGDLNKIVAVSGYFLWVHIGHIEYFQKAKRYGKVVAILNNDKQQKLKYGKIIVPVKERAKVLKAIKYIDDIFISIDKDETVCKSLAKLKPDYFVKGGDRTYDNIPEREICEKLGIKMIFRLGKKIQSSSKLYDKISSI